MSRTRHADSSWRAWGEYRKERSRLKDFDNWKQEALEELEDMANNAPVYIIVNEWLPKGAPDELTEIVGSMYFQSEDEAWDRLADIADSFDATLDHDSLSVDVPDDKFEHQTYFIQELYRG